MCKLVLLHDRRSSQPTPLGAVAACAGNTEIRNPRGNRVSHATPVRWVAAQEPTLTVGSLSLLTITQQGAAASGHEAIRAR